MAMRDNSYSR